MASIPEIQKFRQKYPDYNDIDDATLAGKLAQKYPDAYADLPKRVAASVEKPSILQRAKGWVKDAAEGMMTESDMAADASKVPLKSVGRGAMKGYAKTADTALGLVGALAPQGSNSPARKLQENITEPAIRYWTKQNPSTAEQVGEGLGEIGSAVTFGQGAIPVMAGNATYQTGKELIEGGATVPQAQKAGAIQGAAMAVMGAIPAAGKTIPKTVALATANPAIGAASRAATQKVLEDNPELAKQFDPLNPVALGMDVASAGLAIPAHLKLRAQAVKAKPVTDPTIVAKLEEAPETPRPTHENLGEGVTAKDSLAVPPEVKPVVKGTTEEMSALKSEGALDGKVLHQKGDAVYAIDPKAVDVEQAKVAIEQGGDAESAVLGYPPRDAVPVEQRADAAVTKQGEVVTDLPMMKAEASAGTTLEDQGYIPVFRGTGAAGLKEIRPSSEGINGEGGVFFYRRPQDAAAYAERGGGIITGYVHPKDVTMRGDVVVLKDPTKLLRRSDIPTEETLVLRNLDTKAKQALQKGNIAWAAEGEKGAVEAQAKEVAGAVKIYRAGNADGRWWSESEEYSRNGFPGKPFNISNLPDGLNILDATDTGQGSKFWDLFTPDELSKLNKPENWGNRELRESIYDDVLKRNKYDAVKLLDESGSTGEITNSYYFSETPMTGNIAAGSLAYGQELPKYAGNINKEVAGAVKGDATSEYADIYDQLSGQTFHRSMKGRNGFATESDFQTALRDQYPSVAGMPKAEVLEALAIKVGKSKKKLTPFRQQILDAFEHDLEGYRQKNAEVEAELAAEREAIQSEGAKGDTSFEFGVEPNQQRFDGDQGKMFATPPEFGRKTQGRGVVEENPMWTEMKEREAEKQQGGLFASTGKYADSTPSSANIPKVETRTVKAMEMPEIVELSRDLMNGKYPIVKQKLRAMKGQARGVFKGEGEGKVELRADIFAEPGQAEKTLAHEVGHLVDWLPDKDMKRGNLLGRVATLKKYIKTLIDEFPRDPSEIITKKERGQYRKQAMREIGPKPPSDDPGIYDWRAAVSRRYKEIIEEQIAERGLITRDEISGELKSVSYEWRPFDPEQATPEFLKYRESGPELYADAISALVNNPGFLFERAPKFTKSFFEYLERKPEVKTVYDTIQDRLGNTDAIQDARIKNVYEMFERGNEARNELNAKNLTAPEGVKDTAMRWLVDKYHDSLKHLRKMEEQGGAAAQKAQKARFDLEETNYIASEAEAYLGEVSSRVMKPMEQSGISAEDVGAYMFLRRVTGERSDMANPLGHTENTAGEMLAALRGKWGDEKFAAVEKLVGEYRTIREQSIIPRIEASRLFTPELLDKIKTNSDYSRFSVQKFLEDKFGGGVTSQIYKQIGTLSEIENPFIATVMQDMSLIRAAKINESKSSLVSALSDVGLVTPAEMRWSQDIGGRVPKEPKDPRQAVLTLMVDGKPQHVYVSKPIADTFKFAPMEATKAAEIWGILNQPIRDILVSKNPVWMARNVMRDFRQTIKNNPEVRMRDIPNLAKQYKKAFGEVWRDVMRDQRSADIAEMRKNRMLTVDRVYEAREKNFENELQRLETEFNHKEMIESNVAWRKMKKVYNYLDKLGKVSEYTGKVAGYKYLKEKTNLSTPEISHRVRTRIGTPDYKRQGKGQQITNNVFMFSNVNKEGLRSAYEAFKQDKSVYIWKTIAFNIMPKAILMGAAYFGSQEVKDLIGKIPSYHKRMYTVIPLWMTEDDKAAYLAIPEDYEGQFFGALAWNVAHGNFGGKDGVVGLTAAQSPYRLHPLIKVGKDLYDFYANNLNPVDEFRGRHVIPENVFRAGGAEAHKAIWKNTWRNVGGSVIYEPSYNEFKPEKSGMEKVLRIFPLNTLGAYLKISDQGETEKGMEAVKEVRQQQEQKRIEVQKYVAESIKNGDDRTKVVSLYNELYRMGLTRASRGQFLNNYNRYKARMSKDSFSRSESYVRTKAEKEALKQAWE